MAATLGALAAAAAVLATREGAPEWFLIGLSLVGILALLVALTMGVLEWRAARRTRGVGAVPGWRWLMLASGAVLLLVLSAVAAELRSGSEARDEDVPYDTRVGTGPYHVVGTCANSTCVLYERRAPSRSSEKVARLREGQRITIVCQTRGESLRAPDGSSSDVWDRLYDRRAGPYISDYFTDTPGVGRFTRGIPRC